MEREWVRKAIAAPDQTDSRTFRRALVNPSGAAPHNL